MNSILTKQYLKKYSIPISVANQILQYQEDSKKLGLFERLLQRPSGEFFRMSYDELRVFLKKKNPALDMRKNARHQVGTIYEMRMMHTDYLEHYLSRLTRNGYTINICCGQSEVGDDRYDINPNSKANIIADFWDILGKLKDNEADYIIIDPRFQWYNPNPLVWKKEVKLGFVPSDCKYYGHPFKWQYALFEKCRRAMVTRRGLMQINMQGVARDTDFLLPVDERPAATIVRIDWK